MKYIFSVFLVLAGLMTNTETDCETCQGQNKDYTCAGNTLSMNFRLCMDMTEVSGLMYKTFLEDMKVKYGDGSKEYINNLPNFRKWESLFPGKTMDELSRQFLETELFALMPIVAISYDQAIRFCDWRTAKFKEELSTMDPKKRAMFPKDFKFRLPTAKEWARIRFMYQEKGMLKQIKKTSANNLKVFKVKKNPLMNNNLKISHIYTEQDPKLGMYNLFNSVAEMTSEKGVAMGGSWKAGNDAKKFVKQYKYTEPDSWLGFRCIFEIID